MANCFASSWREYRGHRLRRRVSRSNASGWRRRLASASAACARWWPGPCGDIPSLSILTLAEWRHKQPPGHEPPSAYLYLGFPDPANLACDEADPRDREREAPHIQAEHSVATDALGGKQRKPGARQQRASNVAPRRRRRTLDGARALKGSE